MKTTFIWGFKLIVLFVLFVMFSILGSMFLSEFPEMSESDPGLVSENLGFLIFAFSQFAVIVLLILTSRWQGWKLAAGLSLAYYGAVTFVTQIETWYFLSSLTVTEQLLVELFLMGLPVAFIFIPLAVWIIGDKRIGSGEGEPFMRYIPAKQWVWKLGLIVIAYLILYWTAGYFIAWQNPDLRAFYGQPGEAMPFFEHTAYTFRNDPTLFLLQVFRALIWTLCAIPVIRGSKLNVWWTALLVGLFFSVPQNMAHIMANPLIPDASVRLSHLVETASSTFVFGVIIVWLLHRRHESFRDLFLKGF